MRSDGKYVGLTDETFGFGFVTYSCIDGSTCGEGFEFKNFFFITLQRTEAKIEDYLL